MKMISTILIFFITTFSIFAQSTDEHRSGSDSLSSGPQKLTISDPYLQIRASATDPLYTTYAASMERSKLYGDKAYKMVYYENNEPLYYHSDQAGRIFNFWLINSLAIDKISKFFQKPMVVASFPDMALVEYQPFRGIEVQELFFNYSSQTALVRMHIVNNTDKSHLIDLYPVIEFTDQPGVIVDYDTASNAYIVHHTETKERLISDLYDKDPYPTDFVNSFRTNTQPESYGAYQGDMDDFYNEIKTDWYDEDRSDKLNFRTSGETGFISFHSKIKLEQGEKVEFIYARGVQDQSADFSKLQEEMDLLFQEDLQRYVDKNIDLFSTIPRINFRTWNEKLVYLGSFNLVRGCMLPPSGKTDFNYYVFSRNPIWGWGHGHQVLHESLSMLSYVYLDHESAQQSQRVYMEQQGEDGLIAYRHGPRGAQTYPHKGMPTTSAPFYNWINLELYKVSKDEGFLKDAYRSGAKYAEWLFKNRDTDNDTLFEWGPYGIIENVRDWYNVIFQVSKERYLDIDKEDISDELECLDLSVMMVNELRSLSQMAGLLDKPEEALIWQGKAEVIGRRINELMWDDTTGFYYHLDKKSHAFQFMERDLKRPEIIGFLPLWAGIASPYQAARLIQKLTNPEMFWRKYGIPTLSADDPWYTPYVDYCCKWNGPVWLLWDYMVFRGLLNYGYIDIAQELGDKMLQAVTTQLSVNHNFWESYSPDNEVLDCPSNYIFPPIISGTPLWPGC
jgi:hypothetical protein